MLIGNCQLTIKNKNTSRPRGFQMDNFFKPSPGAFAVKGGKIQKYGRFKSIR